MKTLYYLLMFLLLGAGLAGCGQTGPLYLPPPPPVHPHPVAQTVVTTHVANS